MNELEIELPDDEPGVLTVFRYGNVTYLDIGVMFDHLAALGVDTGDVDILKVRMGISSEPEAVLGCAS